MVDILPQIAGVDFDVAYTRCVKAPIDVEGKIVASFISVGDLIAAKLAAGREQDLADVAAIQQAKEATSED